MCVCVCSEVLCLSSGSHSQVLLQFVHDDWHPVGWYQHHSPERLHGGVIVGPPAAQAGVRLLLHRVVELDDRLL